MYCNETIQELTKRNFKIMLQIFLEIGIIEEYVVLMLLCVQALLPLRVHISYMDVTC